ncbi:phosphoglycerate kinase [Patescibacteria group bacterium]|nr:phosphoglycerate kinase [Patescibacteria group bacterium]
MISIKKLTGIKDFSVLIRVDYNVPMKNGKVLDTRRIESSYATIDTVLKKGGIPLLLAHSGNSADSLRGVATVLSKHYNVVFVTNDLYDMRTHEIISTVPKGAVILFENIRRYEGEESNDKKFAELLASYGDVYVNDAFSVSHRKHASTVGIPKFLPSYAGVQLEKEIQALSSVIEKPISPFLFILGGAKFSTKIPLLKKFATSADSIVVGGAILNNFYKAAGFPVGDSVVEEGYDAPVKTLLKNPKLLLPIDVVVSRAVLGKTKKITISPDEVQPGDVIADIGVQSTTLIGEKIKKAKLVVWNGPMGWYEKGFTAATRALAQALSVSKATTIIGGGDTAAAIESVLDTATNKKIFISTGGGATLDYLANGTLPGIKALG